MIDVIDKFSHSTPCSGSHHPVGNHGFNLTTTTASRSSQPDNVRRHPRLGLTAASLHRPASPSRVKFKTKSTSNRKTSMISNVATKRILDCPEFRFQRALMPVRSSLLRSSIKSSNASTAIVGSGVPCATAMSSAVITKPLRVEHAAVPDQTQPISLVVREHRLPRCTIATTPVISDIEYTTTDNQISDGDQFRRTSPFRRSISTNPCIRRRYSADGALLSSSSNQTTLPSESTTTTDVNKCEQKTWKMRGFATRLSKRSVKRRNRSLSPNLTSCRPTTIKRPFRLSWARSNRLDNKPHPVDTNPLLTGCHPIYQPIATTPVTTTLTPANNDSTNSIPLPRRRSDLFASLRRSARNRLKALRSSASSTTPPDSSNSSSIASDLQTAAQEESRQGYRPMPPPMLMTDPSNRCCRTTATTTDSSSFKTIVLERHSPAYTFGVYFKPTPHGVQISRMTDQVVCLSQRYPSVGDEVVEINGLSCINHSTRLLADRFANELRLELTLR